MKGGIIKSERVRAAMTSVDRSRYLDPRARSGEAYIDAPSSIGFRATISAPHMVKSDRTQTQD